jgi:hypothetical protein
MNLRDYYDLLDKHDWYASMGDDPKAYSKAKKAELELLKLTELSQDHKALFEAMEKHYWTGEAWFTNQAPKPKRPEE